MFFDDDDKSGINDTINLKCPKCGSHQLHHGRITIFDRGEDADTLLHTDANEGAVVTKIVKSKGSGNPSPRRDGLVIQFWCETCPKEPVLELTIAQHKGSTEIGWRTARQNLS